MKKLKLLLFGVVLAALLALPGAASAKSRDRDHDKMPDKWERHHGLSTHKNNAKADPDKDGLNNLGEFRSRTNPRDPDTDNDGIEDGDDDGDGDGVDNQNEVQEGTSPTDRDTDNDGKPDGAEDRDHDGLDNAGEDQTANDPNDQDTDNDGVEDGGEVAGTIVSFTPDSSTAGNGVLVIRRADNSEVTGNVNGTTEIKCETEDEHEDGDDSGATRSRTMFRDGSGDDNSGSGTSGSGDDGDRSGDDNSGPGSTSSGPGSGSDEGDNSGDRGDNSGPGSVREHDGDEDNRCTTADLTPGTAVHEAELQGTGADAVFGEIELLK
jgi:hypothetical protein